MTAIAAEPLSDSRFSQMKVRELILSLSKDMEELKLLTCFTYFAFILTGLGIRGNLKVGFLGSKYSFSHCVETLLPLILIAVFLWSSLTFTSMAWTHPIVILLPIGFFFSLNCSRMIIATVTKQRYHFFENLHLSLPFIFSITCLPFSSNESLAYLSINISCALIYFWYILSVINQITSFLDINCLSIKNKSA